MSGPSHSTKRADLPPMELAVSDALDDLLMRQHGILTSHSGWDLFLGLLRESGYDVTAIVCRFRRDSACAGAIDWRPEPYLSEVNDEEVFDWMCERHWQERKDDV